MKNTKQTAVETTAASPAVFAKSENIAQAIIHKSGLPEGTVIILADDNNPKAYAQMAAHPGTVYCTQVQEQRLGKAQVKVSLFPKGVSTPDLGNSPLAIALAKKAKADAWEVLRNPATPSEVIESNLGEPVQILGLEMNKQNKLIYDSLAEIIKAASPEATEAFNVLNNLLGNK